MSAGSASSADSSLVFAEVEHSGQEPGEPFLRHPEGLAFEADGDVLVADEWDNRIERFAPSGEYLSDFGSQGRGDGELDFPADVAVAPSGVIWVADQYNSRIEAFSPEGEYLRQAGSEGGGEGELEYPEGLAVAANGDVWVADTDNGRLEVFNEDGTFVKTVTSAHLTDPDSVAFTPSGEVWVSDGAGKRLVKFNGAGEYLESISVQSIMVEHIWGPRSVAVGDGVLWAMEEAGKHIYELSESGALLNKFGYPDEGNETLGTFSDTSFVAMASDGMLWATDEGKGYLDKWSDTGVAPSNAEAPSISGAPGVGNTLIARPGGWNAAPTPAFSYEWETCGGSGCEPIFGANSQTYIPSEGMVGTELRVRVRATNESGTETAVSPTTMPIAEHAELVDAASEGYGSGNAGESSATGGQQSANAGQPHRITCTHGDPVNCATGNEVESQTDLSVGGDGPPLEMTRTYNSQLARSASSPGIFGYGWTGSYSAHLTLEEECHSGSCIHVAVVAQDNGSTVEFQEAGGAWEPATGLTEATLTNEGSHYVYTLPGNTRLEFDEGRLTREVAPTGAWLAMIYNAEDHLATVIDEAGRELTLAYNQAGQVESITDPMGHTVHYTYSGGNLVSISQPGGEAVRWSFEYDADHELTALTDGRGKTTSTEYNEAGQVISQTDARRDTTTWRYTPATDSTPAKTVITEPNADTIEEEFNREGMPTRITQAGGSTECEYNELGYLVATTDPEGDETKISYDSEGNRTSETTPLKETTHWTYNNAHEVTSSETPSGLLTTIERNGAGQPTLVTRSASAGASQTTQYDYDERGHLTAIRDARDDAWHYSYDEYGDRISETTPEGEETSWVFNRDSQEMSETTPRGNIEGADAADFTKTIERDAQGRPLKVSQPGEGSETRVTEYSYDPDGNLHAVKNPEGHETSYSYNPNDEPIKVVAPNGQTTETAYNDVDEIESQTNGKNETTTYRYNALHEAVEETDPLNRTTSREYDRNGQLTGVADPAGHETSYSYDADGQLTEIEYPSGQHSVEYEYTSDGARKSMTDGTGTTSYSYDGLQRLSEVEDGAGDTIAYEYNPDNQPKTLTYPNGQHVENAYDQDGLEWIGLPEQSWAWAANRW